MKYYYLDGANKLGPFSKEEILSKKLNPKTLVFREDKENWLPLSEFEELKPFEDIPNSQYTKKQNDKFINNKSLLVGLFIVVLSFVAFAVYNYFSFSEKEARETANKFFNMLMVENQNIKAFDEIYPEMKKMSQYTIFKKKLNINSVFKNSDGDYEVYASLNDPNPDGPIFILLSKKNNSVYIKTSRGINYAYYNKLLEYGKKRGCLTGVEDDLEMSTKIKEKRLQWDFDIETSIMRSRIERNIKISEKIENKFGFISGNVTITNNNDFVLNYGDLDVIVEFYDSLGNIVDSKSLTFFTLNANSSSSSSVFSSGNAASYKVITKINDSENLLNKVRGAVVQETINNCH